MVGAPTLLLAQILAAEGNRQGAEQEYKEVVNKYPGDSVLPGRERRPGQY